MSIRLFIGIGNSHKRCLAAEPGHEMFVVTVASGTFVVAGFGKLICDHTPVYQALTAAYQAT